MASILSGLFAPRYTIGELMAVDQGRQQKAANCKVTLIDTFYTLKEEGVAGKVKRLLGKTSRQVFYVTFKVQVKSDSGHTYNVFMQVDPDFNLSKGAGNQIRIFCGCPDFKYRSAYQLDKRDSLFLNGKTKSILGDGYKEEPSGKRGTTTLCKHAYAAVNWLLNNYEKLMKKL